jgi:CRISPR/Cas system-associated endoribonuclease Cas2
MKRRRSKRIYFVVQKYLKFSQLSNYKGKIVKVECDDFVKNLRKTA